jgi:hypothetical protein
MRGAEARSQRCHAGTVPANGKRERIMTMRPYDGRVSRKATREAVRGEGDRREPEYNPRRNSRQLEQDLSAEAEQFLARQASLDATREVSP